MTFPDDIPTSKMSPPQFSSLNSNDFKREGTSYSNALICPPPRMTLPQSNRSDHIFYKTRICAKFRFRAYRNGKNCNFAHGAEEIRQPPPNWQNLVVTRNEDRLQLGNRAEDRKIIQSMKLCKNYCNGEECPYGDKCIFLHEEPAQFRDDSLKSRECSAITIVTNSNLEGNRAVNNQARGPYRKTKLCRNWKDTGYCSYGKNCLFAHGEEGWLHRTPKLHVYMPDFLPTAIIGILLMITLLKLRFVVNCSSRNNVSYKFLVEPLKPKLQLPLKLP